MFRRNSEHPPRRPTPIPPTPDDDATEVHSGWQSTLHRHIQAQHPQAPTNFPALPIQNIQYSNPSPPVGPLPQHHAHDGLRHAYPAHQVPQRAYPAPTNPPVNDETAIFSRIPTDPTDIGAIMAQEQALIPHQEWRELEYYGDPAIKNIVVVAGYQVHSANPAGVVITENGPNNRRTLIPWHRVHNLRFAPGDSMLSSLHNYNS